MGQDANHHSRFTDSPARPPPSSSHGTPSPRSTAPSLRWALTACQRGENSLAQPLPSPDTAQLRPKPPGPPTRGWAGRRVLPAASRPSPRPSQPFGVPSHTGDRWGQPAAPRGRGQRRGMAAVCLETPNFVPFNHQTYLSHTGSAAVGYRPPPNRGRTTAEPPRMEGGGAPVRSPPLPPHLPTPGAPAL